MTRKLIAYAIITLLVCAAYALSRGEQRVVSVQPKMDIYEYIIYKRALEYHGILSAECGDGEPYFIRNGKRCNLLSTIRKWRVIL